LPQIPPQTPHKNNEPHNYHHENEKKIVDTPKDTLGSFHFHAPEHRKLGAYACRGFFSAFSIPRRQGRFKFGGQGVDGFFPPLGKKRRYFILREQWGGNVGLKIPAKRGKTVPEFRWGAVLARAGKRFLYLLPLVQNIRKGWFLPVKRTGGRQRKAEKGQKEKISGRIKFHQ
jgi:hypothetical protein